MKGKINMESMVELIMIYFVRPKITYPFLMRKTVRSDYRVSSFFFKQNAS